MFSARNARVRVGVAQSRFVGVEWRVRATNSDIDTTSFEDGGYSNCMSSIWDVEVEVRGFWNQAINPHSPPSNIYDGSTIQDLQLYLDAVNAPLLSWMFPYFYVRSTDTDAVVRDGMKFAWFGKNKGPFLRPGELVAKTPPLPLVEDRPVP